MEAGSFTGAVKGNLVDASNLMKDVFCASKVSISSSCKITEDKIEHWGLNLSVISSMDENVALGN